MRDKLESISQKLLYLRKSKGLSREALAEKLEGYNYDHIAKVESEVVENPKIDFLVKICEFFNVEEKWFLTGEGPTFKIPEPEDRLMDKLKEVKANLTATDYNDFLELVSETKIRNTKYTDHIMKLQEKYDAIVNATMKLKKG